MIGITVLEIIKILLGYSCFKILSKQQSESAMHICIRKAVCVCVCVCLYPLFFGFLSHLGHHRALSRVSCAIQQVLISYLLYT